MRSTVAITVLVSLSLLPTASSAQGIRQDLRGMLIVKPGIVAPFVWLSLQESGTTIKEVALEDRRFAFQGLRPGRYRIEAEAPGFDKASVDLNFPRDQFVEIELRPLRRESGRPEITHLSELLIPGSARREFAVGKKKVDQDRCNDAFNHLKKAVEIYRGYGDAHRSMGECYAKMGQLDVAEQEYKQALEQIHRPDLHLQLGMIYARNNDGLLLRRQVELYVEEETTGPFRDRMRSLLERHSPE